VVGDEWPAGGIYLPPAPGYVRIGAVGGGVRVVQEPTPAPPPFQSSFRDIRLPAEEDRRPRVGCEGEARDLAAGGRAQVGGQGPQRGSVWWWPDSNGIPSSASELSTYLAIVKASTASACLVLPQSERLEVLARSGPPFRWTFEADAELAEFARISGLCFPPAATWRRIPQPRTARGGAG
jgi:hypothetical protein